MIETILGVIFGSFFSWIITHWYYKKQETYSPAPMIREIRDKIEGLYHLETVKKDKELQNKLKQINLLISAVHRKVLHILLPLDINVQALRMLYASGQKDKLVKYLNEFLPELIKFHDKYVGIAEELKNLSNKTKNVFKTDKINIGNG